MSEGSTDLAKAFKHIREQRQLSRTAASTAAQVPAHYLAVLEGEGEKHWLADPLYLIPFIRAYARFLDIDTEAAVAQFLSTLHQTEVEGIEPTVIIQEHQTRFPFGPIILGAGLMVAIALLFFIWHQQAQDMTSPQISSLPPESALGKVGSQEEVSSQSVSPLSPPAQEAASLTPPSTSVSAPAPSPARAVSAPAHSSPPLEASLPVSQQEELAIQGKHSLQVRATQQVWLRVVVDDQQATQALLQPGDGRTWHAQEGFIVTVGNAGGVEFTLDNQPIPPLGMSGQVVRDVRLPASEG